MSRTLPAATIFTSVLPCLIFEDEDLLVVNKPAGMNTHAPSPFAGEGLYDWLRHREPRWAKLAIMHRLDRETSGVIVFSKTERANRALAKQFEERTVKKKYVFLTAGRGKQKEFTAKTCLARAGEKYVSRPVHAGGILAETWFCLLNGKWESKALNELNDLNLRETALWEAQPITGRTHQIRVHAAENGVPILGDVLYGGPEAARVFLHANEITLKHPATMQTMTFRASPDFEADPRSELRKALIDPHHNNAYRLLHGASDRNPGWYVDRLGDFLFSQGESEPDNRQRSQLLAMGQICKCKGTYHKNLVRDVSRKAPQDTAAPLISGNAAAENFVVLENELQFQLSFQEGYSVGLFLDQRDNRRRVLHGHIGPDFLLYDSGKSGTAALGRKTVEPVRGDDWAPDTPLKQGVNESIERVPQAEVLNAFAYTCAFSVCAAKAGARVTSLDLSKKYLSWGKRNFELNQLDPGQHNFIFGDVFDWLPRLTKKGRRFDVILLDPPTFSQSREFGVFRAEKDYGGLVGLALPLLKPDGVIFCSSNAARWKPENFLALIKGAIQGSKRRIVQEKYFPQPPDFPISRDEPGYLKTVWLRVR